MIGLTTGRRISIGSKKKIAFVCSGGGVKAGAFHVGVALALRERGFKFRGGLLKPGQTVQPPGPMEVSTYVGSSAGSITSAYLAAGYSLDNIFNSFLGREPSDPRDTLPRVLARPSYQKMFRLRPGLAREQVHQLWLFKNLFRAILAGDWDTLLQLKWFKTTGIFSTEGIEQYFREEVLDSNRFQDYIADLFVVTTQLNHSRKVVFGKYDYDPPIHDHTCRFSSRGLISEAIAASTALPFVFAPYSIPDEKGEKVWYIDGETRDTLSTHVAVDGGADLVVASYTHQPYHLKKETGSLTEYGLPSILIQSIYLIIEQKINHQIHHKRTKKNAIDAVMRFCREEGIDERQRKRLFEILEKELHHRMGVDTIYIHPNPADTDMFFGEHFNLSAKRMSEYVKSGFRAAIDVLRKYEFADEPRRNPIVAAAAR